jgi:hypothetical protein
VSGSTRAQGRVLHLLRVLLALMIMGLGLALVVVTLVHGGGEVGIVLGVLFSVAGGGRLYLMRQR